MFIVLVVMLAFQTTPAPEVDANIQALLGRLQALPEHRLSNYDDQTRAVNPPPPAAEATTERFDLVCTNRREIASRRPTALDDLRFRVDLSTSRYCVGPCADMRTLTVYPATLVFSQIDDSSQGFRMQARQSVDRHTGAFEFMGIGDGRIVRHETGQCRVAEYTGPVRGERLF